MSHSRKWVLGLMALFIGDETIRADAKTKAAQEAAEVVMARFGARAGRSLPALAGKIEALAARFGPESLVAVRRVGPEAITAIEAAGINGSRAARLLAQYGEEGATCVLRRPRAMQQFLRYGEEAASVLVKHPGAETLIEQGGSSAVRALAKVTPQGARRMAMVMEGELKGISRKPELLEVIARYGQRACDFIWANKGALTIAATLTAFLATPEPFINGTKELVKPIAEVPGILSKEGAAEAARNTNWTLIWLTVIAIVTLVVACRWRLFNPRQWHCKEKRS